MVALPMMLRNDIVLDLIAAACSQADLCSLTTAKPSAKALYLNGRGPETTITIVTDKRYANRDGVASGASTLAGRNLSKHKIRILEDGRDHIILSDVVLPKIFSSDLSSDYRACSFCSAGVEDMAPEEIRVVVNGYNRPVDWWSVGMLTCELLIGISPFTVEQQNVTCYENQE
uniref:Protein kinase domain-containing protein n=1 Tax=Glossina austeni TaxID=7395 RepID=A0A1A9VT05_GLOAU